MTDETKSPETEAIAKANKRKLIALFAIGFVPLFVAYGIFFFFPELMPSSTTNEGVLVQPPLHAETFGIDSGPGKWALILPVGISCDEECESRFYFARQVNIALGKDSDRLYRILLTFNTDQQVQARIMSEYPKLDPVIAKGALSKLSPEINPTEHIFLMDPFGNILMYYSLDKAGGPMLKDIKHLLKISSIG